MVITKQTHIGGEGTKSCGISLNEVNTLPVSARAQRFVRFPLFDDSMSLPGNGLLRTFLVCDNLT